MARFSRSSRTDSVSGARRGYRRPGRVAWVLRKQGVLLGLIGFMALVFLLQSLAGFWWFEWMCVPEEIGHAWAGLKQLRLGLPELRTLLTLFSAALLHGDFEHLLYNMAALWIFGALVADLLGWRWLLLTFVVTAVGGSICHVAFNAGSPAPCLGASGAVMGMEGAYLGLAVRFLLPEPQVWPMSRPVPPAHLAGLALFGVFMDYTALMDHAAGNIAYGAHIGGFTAGLLLAALAAPLPNAARPR